MAITATQKTNVVIPEVMADMIREELPARLAFGAFLDINTDLVGVPGDTITLPKWSLIDVAEDVSEMAEIPYSTLKSSKTKIEIKKVGRGVEISDEAQLSGMGNPMEEAKEQILMAIARKIDADALVMFKGATLKYNRKSTELSYDVICDALTKFGEKVDVDRVMYVTPEQYAKLRKDPNWIKMADLTGVPVGVSGVVGKMASVFIKVTNADLDASGAVANVILEGKCGTLALKREANVETARDIDKKATKINADQFYGMGIKDDTKVLVLTTKKSTVTASEM